jgi:hypothetical protein
MGNGPARAQRVQEGFGCLRRLRPMAASRPAVVRSSTQQRASTREPVEGSRAPHGGVSRGAPGPVGDGAFVARWARDEASARRMSAAGAKARDAVRRTMDVRNRRKAGAARRPGGCQRSNEAARAAMRQLIDGRSGMMRLADTSLLSRRLQALGSPCIGTSAEGGKFTGTRSPACVPATRGCWFWTESALPRGHHWSECHRTNRQRCHCPSIMQWAA